MTTSQPAVPNHHAHYPGFAGLAGVLAAVTMLPGGMSNARLAERLSELAPGDAVADIERLSRPGATGLASHGWTPEQASAFADRCRAHGFTDPKVEQHAGARRSSVSVTATA